MNMRPSARLVAGLLLTLGSAVASFASDADDGARVARGKYIVMIGGCNDCHTPGYGEKGGEVPESEWLIGSPVGFQGPWGTSYAANLRLVVQAKTEAEWMKHARRKRLPPMPWFNMRAMSDEDLGAMYVYIKSLGAPGEAAPEYVAPGGKVTTPYIVFVPREDK
jgi:mono/diheme cytochrome c family protein